MTRPPSDRGRGRKPIPADPMAVFTPDEVGVLADYLAAKTRAQSAPHPPSERGQGRKPLAKDGELMKTRPVRMTDAEWEAAKLVGMSAIRAFVVRQAKKLRAVDAYLKKEK